MLRNFLESSTAHGVPYLSTERNPLARLLWAACIAMSIAGAAIVIAMNVSRWQNSPAVITGVDSVSVQVGGRGFFRSFNYRPVPISNTVISAILNFETIWCVEV